MANLSKDHEFDAANYLCKHLFGREMEVHKINETSSKTPDILIPEIGVVLEVKQIVDSENLNKSSKYDQTMERLRIELMKYEWSGTYSLSGDFIHISRATGSDLMNKVVRILLAKMLTLKTDDEPEFLHIQDNIHFHINKVEDNGKDIFPSASEFSYGYSQTRCDAITIPNIEKASKQVMTFRATDADTKENWLLLIINEFALWKRHDYIQLSLDKTDHAFDRVFGVDVNLNDGSGGPFSEFKVRNRPSPPAKS